MKKRKNQCQQDALARHNPVAKFACQFNKAQVFGDKSQYRRKAKHPKQDASVTVFLMKIIAQAALIYSIKQSVNAF